MELLIGILGVLAGGILSWVITYSYYRKASREIPDWAKPIVERLPQSPPTKEQLLELFQDALDKGEINPDPIFGYVACPKCKAPSSDFKHRIYSNEPRGDVAIVECPHCGWSNDTEL
jgi:hypothetical protein